MRKAVGLGLSAAAIVATGLIPAAAWAAAASPAAPSAPGAGDPDTTVTFTVSSGALAMTAPTAADLGAGVPGDPISSDLGGAVTVTDDRALLSAAWTATASATSFTTGTATTAETIPVSAVSYDPGDITTTGTITATGTSVTLSGTSKTVVAGTAGVGNNSASWTPGLVVSVPASAVVGLYTGTLTQSVT